MIEDKVEDQPVVADPVEQVAGDTPEPVAEEREEIVVSIGDVPVVEPAEVDIPAPAWVKKVRQRNRELEKELRETRRKLQESSIKVQQEPALGTKPTLSDHNYDTDQYEQALASWWERKKKADEVAVHERAEAERAEQEWQGRLTSYQESKASFKADDYDEAEAVVMEVMNQTQQGIIVNGAADPTLIVYALGKAEDKAKELAAIKDPVKFAFAIAKLEDQVKVTTRKPATQPESRISGSGSGRASGSIDHTLERLREDAARTGDYTKVTAYKRNKRS